MVLSPEHELIEKKKNEISNWNEVAKYIKLSKQKSDEDRLDASKEKTGVKLEGITATNPASGEEIPVFIADYVLAGYGTGAIMAVPAHDERDYEFAQKYNLSIREVIIKNTVLTGPDAVRPGFETLVRDVVDVIIEHPSNGTFLVQKETLDDGRVQVHFTGGGTDGESELEAIRREIIEETGFVNFDILSGPFALNTYAGFRHPKQKNQITQGGFYHVKLNDLKQVRSEVDDGKHEIEWLCKDDVATSLNWEGHQYGWDVFTKHTPFTGHGKVINSGEYNGMDSEEAMEAITRKVGGKMMSTYRLKDWVFSRQRYWGEPIPVVHCDMCGVVPVSTEELPVLLPEVEHYEPTGTGESPLANIDEWIKTTCPRCGGRGKRETNTMPQWAGSSWYYLRFIDPHNAAELIDPKKEKKWMPVDVYVGGDHAVRHLIYARFWHKFLYDIGVVTTLEPFSRLEFLGFIHAEDGRKMSKRWGNIINPDVIVERHGADALRVYEMFMGPFENTVAWSTNGLVGAQRFLERVYGLSQHIKDSDSKELVILLHKTIRKVTSDIETFKFNTAISSMMIFINQAERSGLSSDGYEKFLKILAPFAPHLTEELWENSGHSTSIHAEEFPDYDETLAIDEEVTIGVQINGKTRGSVTLSPDATESEALKNAKESPELSERLLGEVVKVIYVKGRILNIIIR
jgi:leucyl-tRNA synthetase